MCFYHIDIFRNSGEKKDEQPKKLRKIPKISKKSTKNTIMSGFNLYLAALPCNKVIHAKLFACADLCKMIEEVLP